MPTERQQVGHETAHRHMQMIVAYWHARGIALEPGTDIWIEVHQLPKAVNQSERLALPIHCIRSTMLNGLPRKRSQRVAVTTMLSLHTFTSNAYTT